MGVGAPSVRQRTWGPGHRPRFLPHLTSQFNTGGLTYCLDKGPVQLLTSEDLMSQGLVPCPQAHILLLTHPRRPMECGGVCVTAGLPPQRPAPALAWLGLPGEVYYPQPLFRLLLQVAQALTGHSLVAQGHPCRLPPRLHRHHHHHQGEQSPKDREREGREREGRGKGERRGWGWGGEEEQGKNKVNTRPHAVTSQGAQRALHQFTRTERRKVRSQKPSGEGRPRAGAGRTLLEWEVEQSTRGGEETQSR